MNRSDILFFSSGSHVCSVFELLLFGNMDVAMTTLSLGTSRQSEARHISHSCGHTAVFLVPLGVTPLCCHALLSFSFPLFAFSGSAILTEILSFFSALHIQTHFRPGPDCRERIICNPFALLHAHKTRF